MWTSAGTLVPSCLGTRLDSVNAVVLVWSYLNGEKVGSLTNAGQSASAVHYVVLAVSGDRTPNEHGQRKDGGCDLHCEGGCGRVWCFVLRLVEEVAKV